MKTSDTLHINQSPLSALPALLDAWNRHQDLRGSDAPISDLAESRRSLDATRAFFRV